MEVQEWKKGGFSSRLASDEITTRGYKVLTFAKCITILITVLAVTSDLRSSFDKMIWFRWECDGFGLACVELYDL
jgi:hypothetical protein